MELNEIIKVTPDENQGNTLIGAVMTAFNLKHQKHVKTKFFGVVMIVSVYKKGVWTDFDTWLKNGNWYFLLAQ